jgi:hypothetical protein
MEPSVIEKSFEPVHKLTVEKLYQRLSDVNRAMAVKPMDDEFELGIDCRLANEQAWLMNLLHEIEKY